MLLRSRATSDEYDSCLGSVMALCKLIGTWYRGESKLSFQK